MPVGLLHGAADLAVLHEGKLEGERSRSAVVRGPFLVGLVLLLAGCTSATVTQQPPGPYDDYIAAKAACHAQPMRNVTLYLGPQLALLPDLPSAGEAPGNGFTQGFLTNDLKEWLGAPVPEGMHLMGDVTIELWVRSEGTPAPLVYGGPQGQGYHLFNQFGSNRSLQPAYAVEYNTPLPQAGQVDHYTEKLTLSPGGFVVEKGDRVRLLLTGLTLDGAQGPGQTILYGGDTPSRVSFSARCWTQRYAPWGGNDNQHGEADVNLRGNQGLLTGAIPATEGFNQATVGFALAHDVARVTIRIVQTGGVTDPKGDIDLSIVDKNGNEVWSIGSPYTNEQGVLWGPNLHAVLQQGLYDIKVNSYSGLAYTGHLTIDAERPIEYIHHAAGVEPETSSPDPASAQP